jgi:hypothetical protein
MSEAVEAGTGTPEYAAGLEAVREQRDKIKGKKVLELLVPGYKGKMRVVYKDLTDAQHEKLAERVDDAEERNDTEGFREGIADVLIAHCREVQVRLPSTGEFVPIADKGGPMTFGKPLAEAMHLDADTARGVVLEIFSPKDEETGVRTQPDAIAPHMQAIFAWRQGREEEISKDLLGK